MKTQKIKNTLSKVLLLAITLSLFNFTAFANGFTDVSTSTPNSQAILYLQDHGIVKGYDDGTFKPTRDVNRAELLKIIIEGSQIQLDVFDPTPFKDIDSSQWYVPYVKKAYSEGWINGYQDGTFRPTQTINKVEALKIIGEAQSWKLETTDIEKSSWYEPYVNYAESNKYLEEQGTTFSPTSLMTRGSISEIIYRTIVNTDGTNTDTNTTPKDPTVTKDIEPTNTEPSNPTSNFGLLAKNSFENISLSEALPNTFYKNEIYIIKGDVVGQNYDMATVILDSKDANIHKYFSGEVKNNHFEIPVYFKNSGDYLIGMVPGDSGNSDAFPIYVNSTTPASTVTSAAPSDLKNVEISYAKDKTSINFSNVTNTIKKFTFTQNNKTVSYLSRQNISSLNLSYGDFATFVEGSVEYSTSIAKISSQSPLQISSEFLESPTKSFNAVEHSFIDDNDSEIQITMPDNLSSPKQINLSGTAKTDIKKEALVITPDGDVDKIDLITTGQTYEYFDQTIIKSGSTFTFEYTPTTNGRYIIELNNKNSEPSINHPVYVGKITPLIPDFFDTNEREYFKGEFNLAQEREKLLNLINKSRSEHGVEPLALDNQLNTAAQEHSDDMKVNQYFSHYNLNNETPEDRRIALGIATPVGENIARDISVEFAHFGLMRSASHHQNILTADWKRVGLGITLDQGELIIAEEFSIDPVTAENLIQFKKDLIKGINDQRANQNLSTLVEIESLNKSSEQINNDNINSIPITNQTLGQTLQNNSFNSAAQLIGRVGSPWSSIMKSIINEEASLLETEWNKIGTNIQTDKNGKIYTIVIVGNDL